MPRGAAFSPGGGLEEGSGEGRRAGGGCLDYGAAERTGCGVGCPGPQHRAGEEIVTGGGQPAPQPGHCPRCRSDEFKPVTFTWWGGALGPKLLHHVKCNRCGATFNSKKGTSNSNAILSYALVSFVVVAALLYVLITHVN